MKKNKTVLEIILVVTVVVIVGFIYAGLFYNSSQKRILNTLSELSDQSVKVLQREITKGKESLHNLAALLSEEEYREVNEIVSRLEKVNDRNSFKRMGIILQDGSAYTTDGEVFNSSDREYFHKSMAGEDVISDTLIDKLDGDKINVYSTLVEFKNGVKVVLFATYDTGRYSSALSTTSFNGAGYSYLIKENGDYITGLKKVGGLGEFTNLFDIMKRSSSDNIKNIEKMQNEINEQKKGSITYRNGGSDYMYYQSTGINDWYLIMVIPKSVVEKDINGLLTLAYLFGAICAGIFIILTLHIGVLRKENEKALEKIVYVDSLTGKDTYASFKIKANKRMQDRGLKKCAIICLNVDKFQYINDLYGYEEGNHALMYITEMIQKTIQSEEVFARIRADHFVLLIFYKKRSEIVERVKILHKDIGHKTDFNNKHYEIRVTSGIYEIDSYGLEIDAMVDRANMAMNKRKDDVLTKYTFYDDTLRHDKIMDKEMEDRFTEALKNKEFVVYYQPKYSILNDRFQGAEALVRWAEPNKQMIPPGKFISVFERNGSIVALDEYVFEEVCRQIRQWLDQGYEVSPISVNISRLHLYRLKFVDEYLKIIRRYHVPVELIQLELTETIVFDNRDILIRMMKQLQTLGIKILMDDFGSGYSSINMLTRVPIDVLKVDKKLIDECQEAGNGQKIIKTIVSLANELGIQVTAEGVETKEQYEFLSAIHCDYIQGYYCAKPMDAGAYEKIISLNGIEKRRD